MAVIGLLEGYRSRYLGAALVNPDEYQGPANSRDFQTTDWFNSSVSEAEYQAANAKWLDPEAWPTLALFRSAHGGAPIPPAFQPDPAVLKNPTGMTDAEYQAHADAVANSLADIAAQTIANARIEAAERNAELARQQAEAAQTQVAPTPATQSYLVPALAALAAFLALKG